MNKGINLSKIEKMAGLAYENGLRLHFDSVILYENSRYQSAYLLSILALEEIGKAFMLEDFLWHSLVDGRMTDSEENDFLLWTFDHKGKQKYFIYEHEGVDAQSKIARLAYDNKLELLKYTATYVGLPKIKGEVMIKAKIINPLVFTKAQAFRQTRFLNSTLIKFVKDVLKGHLSIDSAEIGKRMNKKLLGKLEGLREKLK